ncbi:MAG: hypothetical protein HC831_25370, partial [Chloroflexia bacterium]|nr:hypothetical protein [Chloroflexia bacterium]
YEKNFLFLLMPLFFAQFVFAQQFEPNYDESKVPQFVVPDPLLTFKLKKVKNILTAFEIELGHLKSKEKEIFN